MSKGSNFKPVLRKNGMKMMRVNPEPLVLDFDETVMILFDVTYDDRFCGEELKTAKSVKRNLAYGASKYNYFGGWLEESPENLDNAHEMFEHKSDTSLLEHYYKCREAVRKYFTWELEDWERKVVEEE